MTTTRNAKASKRPVLSDEEKTARLAEAHQMIADAVAGITSSAEWRAHLAFASGFHTYSFNNVILMWSQQIKRDMSPLTRVAGFGKWRDLGRSVVKGEKGLRIYAPLIVPVREGERGFVPGEKRTRVVGFRLTTVFDVQQTEGTPLPAAPAYANPEGDAPAGLWDALSVYAEGRRFPVRYGDAGDAEGFTSASEIVISDRLKGDGARSVAVLIHEVAHSILHVTGADGVAYDYRAHRGIAETEAEGTAFVVATYFGIDMRDSSAGYVAGWAKDAEVVLKAGQRIMKTARAIIEAVEPSL